MTFSIDEIARILRVPRTQIANYVTRGYIGPRSGKGRRAKFDERDLKAAQIACTLTATGRRVLPKIGREGLYRFVDNDVSNITIGQANARMNVLPSNNLEIEMPAAITIQVPALPPY